MDVQDNFLGCVGDLSPTLIQKLKRYAREERRKKRLEHFLSSVNLTTLSDVVKSSYSAFISYMRSFLKKEDVKKQRYKIDELYKYLLKKRKYINVVDYILKYRRNEVKDSFLDDLKNTYSSLFDKTLENILYHGNIINYDYVSSTERASELFREADAIVVDFETDSVGKTDVDMIIFSALDLKKERVYTTIDELVDNLNDRLLVAFVLKFDIRVLSKELIRRGWTFIREEKVFSSKSVNIITYYEYKKFNRKLGFYVYGIENIFSNVSLDDISKIIIEYAKYKPNIRYADKVINGKGITYTFSDESMKSFKQKLETKSDAFYSIVGNTIHCKNDTAVKTLCEFLNQDLKTSEVYRRYNLIDVYITAVAFLYSTDIFLHSIASVHSDFIVFDRTRRYLTLASLSYDLMLDFCVRDVMEKIRNEELEFLNYKKVLLSKVNLTKFKKIDDKFYVGRKKVIYVSGEEAFIIHFPKLERDWIKSYSGGIVYFDTIEKVVANEKQIISSYDINSSYPTSMSVLGIQPYAKIFEFTISEMSDYDNMFLRFDRMIFRCNSLAVRDYAVKSVVYNAYPELRNFFDLALSGQILMFVDCIITYIDKSRTAYGWRVKGKNGLVGNAAGEMNLPVMCNVFDLFSSNAFVDIRKVYVMRAGNNFLSNFIEKLYARRNELKKQKSSFANTIKLVLNSAYGKFGSLLDNSTKVVIDIPNGVTSFDFVAKFIRSKKHRAVFYKMYHESLNEFSSGTLKYTLVLFNNSFRFYVDGRCVEREYFCTYDIRNKLRLVETSRKFSYSKNNFLCAAAITSYSRLLLSYYKVMFEDSGVRVLYSDTDSLFVLQPIDFKVKTGELLGELKFEGSYKSLRVFAKKIYVADEKIRCKGIRRSSILENKDKFLNEDSFEIEMLQFDKVNSGNVFKPITKKIQVVDTHGIVDYNEFVGGIDG